MLTSSIDLAGDVVYVSDYRKLLVGGAKLLESMVVGGLVPLVGLFLVLIGVFGNDAHEQLIQRVLDAFTIEGRHDDASRVSSPAHHAMFGSRQMWLSRGMARAPTSTSQPPRASSSLQQTAQGSITGQQATLFFDQIVVMAPRAFAAPSPLIFDVPSFANHTSTH